MSSETEGDTSSPSETSSGRRTRSKDKYNLRTKTLVTRHETEERLLSPKTPKPKSRPPPLSKYRRKAANSRERCRMQEINVAFEKLQTVLPINCVPDPSSKNSQLTKITTLRLAVNYIAALRDVLEEKPNADVKESPEVKTEISAQASTSDSIGSLNKSSEVETKEEGTLKNNDSVVSLGLNGAKSDVDGVITKQIPAPVESVKCNASSNEEDMLISDDIIEAVAKDDDNLVPNDTLNALGSILNEQDINLLDEASRSLDCSDPVVETDVNNNNMDSYLSYYDRPPPPYPSSRLTYSGDNTSVKSFPVDYNTGNTQRVYEDPCLNAMEVMDAHVNSEKLPNPLNGVAFLQNFKNYKDPGIFKYPGIVNKL